MIYKRNQIEKLHKFKRDGDMGLINQFGSIELFESI